MSFKEYIGDGVYANVENGELVLTTENGIAVTNRIVFEETVLISLIIYLRSHYPEVLH